MILMHGHMNFACNAFEEFIEFAFVNFTGPNASNKVFISALGMRLEKRIAFRARIGGTPDIYRQSVTINSAVICAIPHFACCD